MFLKTVIRWLATLGIATLAAIVVNAQNAGDNLPDLGDVTASRFSAQQEYELGRSWLKQLRSQVKTVRDPLLTDYLDNLVYRLAAVSELKDRRIETVIVSNPTINAFAVPGGVVGINTGLFIYSDNESQFAGVLGHELAHLSQRHFTRSLDKAKENTLPTIAGLLAGVILAASSNADAGIAAITATQAAALQKQLRFSREHEQEADRIGMETLSRAGMDPGAIPDMFSNMNDRRRFAGAVPPEFLLTHPLTDSRISDSANRARNYPKQVYVDNLNFQLMKRRALLLHNSNPNDLLKEWQSRNQDDEAQRYGIAITLINLERWDEAAKELAPLIAEDPNRIAYVVAQAEILAGQKQYDKAIGLLRAALALSPDNHPLTMALANNLRLADRPQDADTLLSKHSLRHDKDPLVWYELAEIRGLAGNILGVHLARSEYYILVANFRLARAQLHYAYALSGKDEILQARIKQRLRDIGDIENRLKEL